MHATIGLCNRCRKETEAVLGGQPSGGMVLASEQFANFEVVRIASKGCCSLSHASPAMEEELCTGSAS
jgi:hypothetical protein